MMSSTTRPTNLSVSTRVHRGRFSIRSSTRKANETMREEINDQNANSPRETAVLIQSEVSEPSTERKIPEVVAEAGSYPELIAISLVYFVQGIVSLSTLATSYFLKDTLLQSPAQVEFIEGFEGIPWVVKPLYGFASDSIPLFGYRRRSYLILCGLLSSSAWCLLGTNISSVSGVLITLVSASLGTAFSDVVVDSIVVERVRGQPQEAAASLQVICWASRAVGGVISAYSSGYIVDHFGPRTVFRTIACFPLLITVSSFLVKERPSHILSPKKSTKPGPELPRTGRNIGSVLWTQSQALWSAFSQRRIYLPALFMFLYKMAPNASGAMFFYETNELHFTPDFMGKVALIGQIATLLGVGVYNFFLKSVSLKKIFTWSCILSTIIGATQFILITGINREYGLSDQLFVLGDSVVLNVLGEVAFMPGLVLAARICPEGVEATLFALLMSIYNGGSIASSSIGAWLTSLLGVTNDDFSNLIPLLSICLLSNLFPLAFLSLLPEDLAEQKAD